MRMESLGPMVVRAGNVLSSLLLIELSSEQEPRVNARYLHAFLEVGKDFSTWIKDRIKLAGFVKDEDYTEAEGLSSPISASSKARVQKTKEYLITLDLAKELAMLERSDQGKRARRYFIECEKRLRRRNLDFNSPEGLRALLLKTTDKWAADRRRLEAEKRWRLNGRSSPRRRRSIRRSRPGAKNGRSR